MQKKPSQMLRQAQHDHQQIRILALDLKYLVKYQQTPQQPNEKTLHLRFFIFIFCY